MYLYDKAAVASESAQDLIYVYTNALQMSWNGYEHGSIIKFDLFLPQLGFQYQCIFIFYFSLNLFLTQFLALLFTYWPMSWLIVTMASSSEVYASF